MKKILVFGVVLALLCTSSYFSLPIEEIEALEEEGILRDYRLGIYVSNVASEKETAIKIAEAVARDLFKDKIDKYLPFDADEDLNFPQEWRVRSARSKIVCYNGLCGPNIGGPEVHIRKYDGAVTFVTFWR